MHRLLIVTEENLETATSKILSLDCICVEKTFHISKFTFACEKNVHI